MRPPTSSPSVTLGSSARRGCWIAVLAVAAGLMLLPGEALARHARATVAAAAADSPCQGPPPAPNEHCLPIPAAVIVKTNTSKSGCGQAVFLQMPLEPDVVEYDAMWTNSNPGATPWSFHATGGPNGSGSGPYGEEAWSTKSLTPKNTGVNVHYRVPKGSGAWFVAAGGGPGPCSGQGGTAYGWGWTARPVISGNVSVIGTNGQLGAPNITMRTEGCAGGGTTTTNENGDYGFELHPYTTCKVAPVLEAGESATPASRSVHIGTGDVPGVDFALPCDVAELTSANLSSTGSARSLDSARSLAVGNPCKLDVSVTVLNPPHSGLAIHSPHYNVAPADFYEARNGQKTFHCLSGCSDILVKVTYDDTHKPVPDATVDAMLAPVKTDVQPLPTGQTWQPPTIGEQSVCDQTDIGNDNNCGTGGVTTQTDQHGQALLRYWAPGTIVTAQTTLAVEASKHGSCSGGSCTHSERTGSAAPIPLSVAPYLIYDSLGSLSPDEEDDLVAWANGTGALARFLKTSANGLHTLQGALEYLKEIEVAAEQAEEGLKALEKVEPVTKTLVVGEKVNDIIESGGMIALFLEKAGLSPLGLGDNPFEATVSGQPNARFVKEIANASILFPEPMLLGKGGFWYQAARALAASAKQNHGEPSGSWSVVTSVWEVSHCDHTAGSCGPGYGNDPGSAEVIRGGIQPELAFELSFEHNGVVGKSVTGNFDGFAIPYDAIAWTGTQQHVQGVIQDFTK